MDGLDLQLDYDEILQLPHDDGPFFPHTQPPENVITLEVARPRAQGACRVFQYEVKYALRALLTMSEAAALRRRLQDEAVRRCNQLSPGERTVLVGTVTLGFAAWAVSEREKIIEDLGNNRYEIPLPIKELGIPGRLEVGVGLNDYKVDEYTIQYRLRLEF